MKNVNILLFLSDYKRLKSEDFPKGAEEKNYELEGSVKKFKGTQTNDAPMRYMIEQTYNNHGCIKRVLCITSYKVLTEPRDSSQFKRFKQFMNELIDEYGYEEYPEYIDIPYDYAENTMEKKDYGNQLPMIIYRKLSKCFDKIGEEDEVYIDYTGGLRDISFLMTSIIRFLEFKGLKCGEIVYSNKFDRKIYDIHYIYNLYQLINGVNEFTNTGNARDLIKVYGDKKEGGLAENLIKRLIEFSNALSICDIGSLDDRVVAIENAIKALEEDESQGINSEMLKTLAPIIREKMYLSEGFNYPRMIRWCAENNMIQQAATIYTDKMPKYYFDNDLVPDFVDISKIDPSPGHGIYDTGFYTKLFDKSAEGIEIETFRESLKKISLELDELGAIDIYAMLKQIEMESKFSDRKLKNAYKQLIKFINQYYNDKIGNTSAKSHIEFKLYKVFKYDPKNQCADADGYVLGERAIPKKFKEFWGQLISEGNYWLHLFLYNDEEKYLAISTPRKHSSDKTLRKKAFAVQRIKKGEINVGDSCDPQKIYKIMAYYLAVKIMRNRMNHAGESTRTNDEKEAIYVLNNLDIGICFEDNLNSYKDILLKGIEL